MLRVVIPASAHPEMSQGREDRRSSPILKNLLSFLFSISIAPPIFPLLQLPAELVVRVFSFLSVSSICCVSQVCKQTNLLVDENYVWRRLAHAKWNTKERVTIRWKNYFMLKTQLLRGGPFFRWEDISGSGGLRPTRRYQHTSTAVGNNVYLIGGQETQTRRFDDILVFDSETTKWHTVTIREGLPNRRQEPYYSERGASSRFQKQHRLTSSERPETSQGSFPRPPRFARHSAVAIGNLIYVFGGFDGVVRYYDLAVFDTVNNTWHNPEVFGNPPRSRTNHAAAAIGKYMYVFGGINRDNDGNLQDLDEFYALDTETMTWENEVCEGLPPPRCGHKLLSINNKLYLFGGGAGDAWVSKFNDMHIYDPETKKWTKPVCTGDIGVCTFTSAFSLGPWFMVFGGQMMERGDVCNSLYCFDTLTYSWHKLTPTGDLPGARDMASIASVGTSAFLFGGYDGRPLDSMHQLSMSEEGRYLFEECFYPAALHWR